MQESSQVSVYAIVRDRCLGVGVSEGPALYGGELQNGYPWPDFSQQPLQTDGENARTGVTERPSHPQNKTHRAVVDQPHLHMGTEAAGCNPRMRGARQVDQPIEPAPAFLG